MVQCPCHDDKTASLSVGMGEKGIVLHCMAGCDSSDIVRALGLTWRDLCTDEVQREWQAAHPAGAAKTQQKAQKSTKPAAEITTKPPKKIPADLNRLKIGGTYAQKDAPPETITAMYEYTDADGAPLLRVYRTDKKSFPTIHCDGGKWFWGDGGRHNVLYHLPEVVKAVQDGKKVLIVEGEKDVETLRTLGYAPRRTRAARASGARSCPSTSRARMSSSSRTWMSRAKNTRSSSCANCGTTPKASAS